MGCHGAGNDYHLPSVSEWWTLEICGLVLNFQSLKTAWIIGPRVNLDKFDRKQLNIFHLDCEKCLYKALFDLKIGGHRAFKKFKGESAVFPIGLHTKQAIQKSQLFDGKSSWIFAYCL